MADESDDLSQHPDLGATGAALRSEWREDQESATADAAEQFRHNQTLTDVVTQAMHRGDRLALTITGQRFSGPVEEVGPDVIAIRTLFGRVDIHVSDGIALHIETADRVTSGGDRGAQIANTFRAALLARENGEVMTVGTLSDSDGYDGELRVGADFVVVVARGGAEYTVPISSVAWVCARRT